MPEQEEEGRIRFLAGDDLADVSCIPDTFLDPHDTEKGSGDVVCKHPMPILEVGQHGVVGIHIAFSV